MAGMRNLSARATTEIVGAVAALAAREVMVYLWKRITGKAPPTNPEDPQTRLRDALGWALAVGAGINSARVLATRLANSRQLDAPSDLPDS